MSQGVVTVNEWLDRCLEQFGMLGTLELLDDRFSFGLSVLVSLEEQIPTP